MYTHILYLSKSLFLLSTLVNIQIQYKFVSQSVRRILQREFNEKQKGILVKNKNVFVVSIERNVMYNNASIFLFTHRTKYN